MLMADIIFVTTNKGKVEEAAHLLAPLGFEVKPSFLELREIQTQDQNELVTLKALDARLSIAFALIVEDTGFYLEAYPNFPGVFGKYVIKSLGVEGLLKLVEGTNRKAFFRSVVAFLPAESDEVKIFDGKVNGTIAKRITQSREGMPFDQIFIPNGETRTYGEMSIEEKNKVNHRALSMQKLAHWLASGKMGEKEIESEE